MGVNSKVARTLGVASLLAGVMAFAAPMASGAWAAQPACHDDHASPIGDGHQLVNVGTEATTSSSTCPACPTVDPKKGDNESAQGGASESTTAEKGPKDTSTGTTTCPPTVTPPVVPVVPPVVTPVVPVVPVVPPVVTPVVPVVVTPVVTPPVVVPSPTNGSTPVVVPPANTPAGPSNPASGDPGVSTAGNGHGVTGSDTTAGAGTSAPTAPASGGSVSSSTSPSTSHSSTPAVSSAPHPEVLTTTPSGLVVHTVVVPTDAAPAASTPAVVAIHATPDVPTEVLAVSTARSAPAPTLAYTGGSVVKLFVIGLGLVLFGLALLLGSRRTHSAQA